LYSAGRFTLDCVFDSVTTPSSWSNFEAIHRSLASPLNAASTSHQCTPELAV